MSLVRLLLASFTIVALAACTGAKREVELAPLDGSALAAKAYLAEVFGKSGRVITARMDVRDPKGRALAGALVAGRCPRVGSFVDTIPISSATGHFRGSTPHKLAQLAGSHAVVVYVEADAGPDAPVVPVACGDL